jgi:putative tributyrin esterase
MNIATIRVFSQALAREVAYTALIPREIKEPPHVLLQLHGMLDDHTSWLTKSSIARYADGYPFLVVMPSGENGFYLNWGDWANYEDFLLKDLYAHITSTFRVKDGPWAIGGLSMGGYGAMRLGLKYPQRFRSIWSHSGWFGSGVELHQRFPGVPFMRGMTAAMRAEVDILPYAERVAELPEAMRPRIGFDCGTADELLPQNRELHHLLTAMKIEHEYHEHAGGHDWNYWDQYVQDALAFHAKAFGVTREAR